METRAEGSRMGSAVYNTLRFCYNDACESRFAAAPRRGAVA